MFFLRVGQRVSLVNLPGLLDFKYRGTVVGFLKTNLVNFICIELEEGRGSVFVLPAQIFPEDNIRFALDES